MRAQRAWPLVVATAGLAAVVAIALAGEASSGVATFPGKNGRIVLQGTEPGGSELGYSNLWEFRMDAYGGFVQLTHGKAHDANPTWSPDGKWIAFNSNRRGATPTDQDIFVMREDASGLRRVTSGPGADWDPSWSPDGTRLAFMSNRSGNDDIWTVRTDGSGLTNLTPSTPQIDTEPAWSPDGTQILFSSYRDGNQELYVIDTEGGAVTRLTKSPGNDRHPAWSPDGRRIAFASSRSGNSEIYTMNADGTTLRQLTFDPLIDSRPTWSPDGHSIMFQSERQDAGSRQLHLVTAEGTLERQISVSDYGWATSADWQAVSKIDPCMWKGTVFADLLYLGDGADVACALAGNDVVRAFAGNDRVDGGPGNDVLLGAAGNDTLVGGPGNDRLEGGPGRDTLTCGPGRDVVYADALDRVARDCEVVRR